MNLKRLIHIPLALLLMLAVFLISLRLHFPLDSLQNRMQYETKLQSKDTMFLDIQQMNFSGLGIEVQNVALIETPKRGEPKELFRAPYLRVSAPLSSLLTLSPSAYMKKAHTTRQTYIYMNAYERD